MAGRAHLACLLIILGGSKANAGVALLYHHVSDSTPAITSIKPEQFERHLQIIEEQSFTVVPLAELVHRSRQGDPNARIVAITFDDAYRSIYDAAFPKLKARHWPFSIFVAPSYVGASGRYYLTWDQLSEMAEAGASIENHTMTHAHLVRRHNNETPQAWRVRVRNEINETTQVLKSRGFNPTQFAYPYGEYNTELLAMVRDAGLTGFGQQSGAIGPASNLAILPRFPLAGIYTGEAAFRDKLRSLAMPVKDPGLTPLTDKSKPQMSLVFTNPGLNTDRLTCYGPGGLMTMQRTADNTILITPINQLPVGRSRYNCTLPNGNRFYWFSQLWMKKKTNGQWYPEP